MKNRLLTFAAACLLAGMSALPVSALAADLASELKSCRALADAAQRLVCYDAVALDGAAASRDAAPAGPVMSAEERFGLPPQTVLNVETQRGTAPSEIKEISLKVTSLSFGTGGRVVIGLDNGQVWQQLVPGPDLELLKLGDRVAISKGMFGSFWLSAPGGRGTKVSRTR